MENQRLKAVEKAQKEAEFKTEKPYKQRFDMKIGLVWILLIFAFLIAFSQDCKELAARQIRKPILKRKKQ